MKVASNVTVLFKIKVIIKISNMVANLIISINCILFFIRKCKPIIVSYEALIKQLNKICNIGFAVYIVQNTMLFSMIIYISESILSNLKKTFICINNKYVFILSFHHLHLKGTINMTFLLSSMQPFCHFKVQGGEITWKENNKCHAEAIL